MARIEEYAPIVGQSVIDDLKLLAERLKGKVVQQINSTAVGGGVAEILSRLVPLLNQLGVDCHWDLIKGGDQFFEVTKKFHNAIHGRKEHLSQKDFDIFVETSEQNIRECKIYGDVIFIHDPQPIMLIKNKKDNKWLWRCHIDVSEPDQRVWMFLLDFIREYDATVFSAPTFSQQLPVPQYLIAPSIDPLSDKNKELPPETVAAVLEKYHLSADKPMVTQISRFDRLKDPVGVVEMFKLVRRYNDCQLVLAGGTAADDPEGLQVLEEVKEKAEGVPDVHILLMEHNDTDVNALQRAAAVIVQKSIKEGFGLTISEALWKAKPVVASYVGGIPLQIKHRYSGLLCHSIEGAAFYVKQLLNSPEYAHRLGENGKKHIKDNFLLTRQLRDHMLAFVSLYHPSEDIVYLSA
jgi:trehalose synthase